MQLENLRKIHPKIISIEELRLRKQKQIEEIKRQLQKYFEPIGLRANQKTFAAIKKLEEWARSGVEISIWAQLMTSGKIRRMEIMIDERTGERMNGRY